MQMPHLPRLKLALQVEHLDCAYMKKVNTKGRYYSTEKAYYWQYVRKVW